MGSIDWKDIFSYEVLGVTDPIHNPTNIMDEWYKHQSCPWLAIVMNFEYTTTHYWKEKFSEVLEKVPKFPYVYYDFQCKYRCYHCDRPSQFDYCDYCVANPCYECGQIECGGYCEYDRCPGCEGGRGDMCRGCKQDLSRQC